MMRTTQISQPRASRNGRGRYWQIDFEDINGVPYTTYIYNKMRNFRAGYWHEILQNPHKDFIVLDLRVIKDSNIVDADSTPHIAVSGTSREIDEIVAEIRKELL